MWPAFAIIVCCPASDVSLSDADAFQIPPVVVRAQWILARDHRERMTPFVVGWNTPTVFGYWESECQWRTACWDKLDDVLFCQIPDQSKLRSLAVLRGLLGNDAFYAGQMPAPIPTYRR